MPVVVAALAAALMGGCAGVDYDYSPAIYLAEITPGAVIDSLEIDPDLADRILALDPDHLTDRDVTETLSLGPAPRIINIHGGTMLVYLQMKSFSEFLVGMGYPRHKIQVPATGNYSYSCLEYSGRIAGICAWYYEHEGMRPMIIGHSQGGMQAVKVLYQLSGHFNDKVPLYSPLDNRALDQTWFVDPFTGEHRDVVGFTLPYVTAMGAGGITRLLPNQWAINGRLRTIPDTVEEFTGFYIHGDLLGGDSLGYGDGNVYHANGRARVRNVLLPEGYDHYFLPNTQHLPGQPAARAFVSTYRPPAVDGEPTHPDLGEEVDATNILFAADVWSSIRRHWCLEAQRLLQARRDYRSDL